MKYQRLGDLLVSTGYITEEQLTHALELQKKSPDRLGKILLDNKIITEDQLIEALQNQLGVEFIDLTKTNIAPEMAKIVPRELAKKHNVVPVKIVRGDLYLAMSDPMNFIAIEEVRVASKRRVIPMIATRKATERAIITLYSSENTARAIEEMRHEAGMPDITVAEEPARPDLTDEDSHSAPTIRLVDSIIERAVHERASDIHLEPREEDMLVRMRVDGMMRNILTVPAELQSSVIARIKVMGAMNIAERRVPQDGRANVRVRGKDIDLRISTLPTLYGEKTVMRLLYKQASFLDKHAIGLAGDDLVKYDALMRNSSGVILIVGPTGSGKSSTMYTMISELNRETVNLVTLEDPIEYNVSGINQCQINDKTGMSFANGLRAILRQDPDIIAVGEIRDAETAEIAMRAAITGHLVLSTIHTNDAPSTVDRLIDIGVEPYLIAGALRGIISQRLVRKICPQCRAEREPTFEELQVLHISQDEAKEKNLRVYYGKGCPDCYHTGYYGRTAVFEILMVDTAVAHLITEGGRRDDIIRVAREEGRFTSLLENCRGLVLGGMTSAEEAMRILHTTE